MSVHWVLCAAAVIAVCAESGGQAALRGSVAAGMRNDDAAAPLMSTAFGPLDKLLGTWQGTRGINIVSLPNLSSSTTALTTADFLVLGHEFNETLTFAPILGKVLNRGYSHANQLNPIAQLDQVLMGVTYELRIIDATSGELLHAENGQWLWNQAPGVDPQWTVSRAAIIPHGVSVVALGEHSSLTGSQVEAELQDMKGSQDWSAEPQNLGASLFGYFEGKLAAGCNGKNGSPSQGDCMTPTGRLLDDIGTVKNMSVTRLQVSSLPDGGALAMLPNVKAQAASKSFNATYWLESVTDDDGQTYEQLQYAQNVFLSFETNFACRAHPVTTACSFTESLILWPHIQVNILWKTAAWLGSSHNRGLPYIR